MSIWIPILWIATGICLFAGVHFLRAGRAQGNTRLFQVFGALSIFVAAYIGLGALLQTPDTDLSYAWIERLHVTAACLVYPAGIWFIALYSRMRKERPWVVAGAVVFGILLTLNQAGSHGLLVSNLRSVPPLVLPWGERINEYVSTSPAQAPLYYLATLAVFCWAFWRCFALWKMGEPRRAVPLVAFLVLEALATGYAEYTTIHSRPGLDWDALPFLVLVLLLSRRLHLELRGYAAALDTSNTALRGEIKLRGQAESRLRTMAYNDAISGLPNRHALADWLGTTLAGTPTPRGALLVIDPQRFAIINHALGHRTGDLVIREIGKRLSRFVGAGEFVARLSGDEFAVALLTPTADEAAALAQASQRAEVLRLELTKPLQLGADGLSVNVHVALAMFHQAHADSDSLLRQAYAALHQARQTRRPGPVAFTQTMQVQIERKLRLELDLRSAIKTHQLHLVYQPQADRDGKLVGAEALLRWDHPVYGAVGPREFVQIAENSGQMPALGRQVLHMAFATLATLPRHDSFRLSVNISPWQLFLVDFLESVQTAIRETGVNPQRITLEITETAFIHDIPDAAAKLGALADMGIQVSIDDLGTGYASIALLKTLPVHELKIDQAFIHDMSITPRDRFVAALIALADAIGVRVVAEGVEREEQREALTSMGCHLLQGYLISRPVPVDQLVDQLDRMAQTAGSPEAGVLHQT